jgi:predicted N-acyltransferase
MSQPLPTQLRIVQAIRDIPKAAWDELLDGSSTPFLEWTWLEALEESGSVSPDAGWHPRHLTLWRGSKLVAAAPAYLKDNSHGEFVFDWSWASAAERVGFAYYPKLILAVPLTPATGPRLLVAKGEDRARHQRELMQGAIDFARSEGLSSMHVLFPTEEESAVLEGLGFGVRLGVQYHFLNRGYATPDDFLARFTSKRRHQLRRERRAPAEQGIEISNVSGDALATLDPDEVYRLYCSTVDKFAWGRRHLEPPFFERVLKNFRHRLEVVQAKREGRWIAGAINLRGDDALYGRYWGCFEEHPFLHFNVCQYYPTEQTIERRLARFEPGAGGEHKLVRGFEPRLTRSAHWIFHPALDRAVRDFLTHEASAIREGLPQWYAETGFKDRDPPEGD